MSHVGENNMNPHFAPDVPLAVRMRWTSTELRPAEARQELLRFVRMMCKQPYEGTIRVTRIHDLLFDNGRIRYDVTGQFACSSMSTGSFTGHQVWVFTPKSGKSRILDDTNNFRKNPQGDVSAGMVTPATIDTSLVPIVGWLLNGNPSNSAKLDIVHGKPSVAPEIISGANATVGQNVVPSGISNSSSIEFQLLEGHLVPKRWVFQEKIGGRPFCVTSAVIDKVEFPSSADDTHFDLTFPPGTVILDRTTSPTLFCVIDSDGVERATSDKQAFLRTPYKERISSFSPIPIRKESKATSYLPLTLALCSVAAILGFMYRKYSMPDRV